MECVYLNTLNGHEICSTLFVKHNNRFCSLKIVDFVFGSDMMFKIGRLVLQGPQNNDLQVFWDKKTRLSSCWIRFLAPLVMLSFYFIITTLTRLKTPQMSSISLYRCRLH